MERAASPHLDLVPMQAAMVPAVVEVHYAAFAGYLNTRLGRPYLRAFFNWFCEAEGTIAVCALSGHQPVGYVVGAPLGYTGSLNRRTLLPALWGIGWRPWLFLDRRFRQALVGRGRALWGHHTPDDQPLLPEPTFSLVGIAVAPEAQGQQIGRQLMGAFERQARSLGARSLRLSVYPENRAAQRLYTRAGWQHHPRTSAEHLTDYFYKVLGETSVTATP